MFGSMTVKAFPTPDFGGTAWNMLGPYTPKPKPANTPTPTPGSNCKGFYFAGHCFHNKHHHPTPTPTPSNPVPTVSLPNATPAAGRQSAIG
jgi:hypothetical protein